MEHRYAFEDELTDCEVYGDARRCPHHPHVETSSPDGMFDAPCGECEAIAQEACEKAAFEEEAARFGLTPEDYREQIALANEVLHEIVAEDSDIPF